MSSLSKGAYYYSEAHKIISTDPNQCAGCESNTVMEEVTLREAKWHLSRMDGDGNHVVWHNTDISRPTHYVSTTYDTTWMGSIPSMREGCRYGSMFIGTYSECIEELAFRRF